MKSLARIISFATNPIFILFPIPYLLVFRFGYGHVLAIKWSLFSLIFLIMSGIFVFIEVKNKVFSDMDVSKREQRFLLFAVISGITAIYFISLFVFRAPPILFITVWGIMFGIVLASVINTKIKASLHVSSLTSVLLTLIILYELPMILFLIIPIVAWARIEIRRHSVPEVISGFFLGILLPVLMYFLLKYVRVLSL